MIRVGFVGTGGITERHFTAIGRLREQAEVVAVCDVIEERATAAAQAHGARAYLSFPEMLARERLDALYVCLPPDAHVDQELTAINRGIHLFVEKPLPLDLDKASIIARRAKEAGLVTSVGFHWRHWEHVKAVRAALAGDRVGMALGYFLNTLPSSPWWRIKARSVDRSSSRQSTSSISCATSVAKSRTSQPSTPNASTSPSRPRPG